MTRPSRSLRLGAKLALFALLSGIPAVSQVMAVGPADHAGNPMRTPALLMAQATTDPADPPVAYAVGGIVVERPWARATAPAGRVGGVYLTLRDTGGSGDRLLGTSTDIAVLAQLHNSDMQDGIMRMRPVAGGLAVPPGDAVELAPGGLHIMLMGLNTALEEGSHFLLTLVFEKAGSVTVDVTVAAVAAAGPPAGGG